MGSTERSSPERRGALGSGVAPVYRVSLVQMPFASIRAPSLGLTQLREVLAARFAERVSVEISYLNLDFARLFGIELYQEIADSVEHHASGLGEWLFRQIAFPELADNTEPYFERFYQRRDADFERFKEALIERREALGPVLEDLIETHGLAGSHLVGFGSMFAQNLPCLALAGRLKQRPSAPVICMGGANCEAPMGIELVRHFEPVDFVFSGGALESLPQLVALQMAGDGERCHEIDGVFSKRNTSALASERRTGAEVLHGNGKPPIKPIGAERDINDRIDVRYDDFLDSLAGLAPNDEIQPVLHLETSRGCWWGARSHCTFCGLNGATMESREMRPSVAIDAIRSLFRYADRCSLIECVDNIMPRSYPREVFPFLDTPPSLEIFYETKVGHLTDQDLATLARAGVRSLQPGIEALATSTLKLMRKGTTAFQNIVFLKSCLRHGIEVDWNLLIGFPGEEESVYSAYESKIPTLVHLAPPAGVYPVRFDRFSPYFDRAVEYGLDLHPSDYYEYVFPYGEEVLQNLAYYFVDHNYDAPYFRFTASWLSPLRTRIADWRSRWNGDAARPTLFLERKDGVATVHDTRYQEPLAHELDHETLLVLEELEKPRSLNELRNRMDTVPAGEVERRLALLDERGFLFEERGRFLSLVLDDSRASSAP